MTVLFFSAKAFKNASICNSRTLNSDETHYENQILELVSIMRPFLLASSHKSCLLRTVSMRYLSSNTFLVCNTRKLCGLEILRHQSFSYILTKNAVTYCRSCTWTSTQFETMSLFCRFVVSF